MELTINITLNGIKAKNHLNKIEYVESLKKVIWLKTEFSIKFKIKVRKKIRKKIPLIFIRKISKNSFQIRYFI